MAAASGRRRGERGELDAQRRDYMRYLPGAQQFGGGLAQRRPCCRHPAGHAVFSGRVEAALGTPPRRRLAEVRMSMAASAGRRIIRRQAVRTSSRDRDRCAALVGPLGRPRLRRGVACGRSARWAARRARYGKASCGPGPVGWLSMRRERVWPGVAPERAANGRSSGCRTRRKSARRCRRAVPARGRDMALEQVLAEGSPAPRHSRRRGPSHPAPTWCDRDGGELNPSGPLTAWASSQK